MLPPSWAIADHSADPCADAIDTVAPSSKPRLRPVISYRDSAAASTDGPATDSPAHRTGRHRARLLLNRNRHRRGIRSGSGQRRGRALTRGALPEHVTAAVRRRRVLVVMAAVPAAPPPPGHPGDHQID